MPQSRKAFGSRSSRRSRDLSQVFDAAMASVSDAAHIRAVLIASARLRRPMTYADLLGALGHGFSRPKIRTICKTLDAIDGASRTDGEPELAVLVVKAADGLPGVGWWGGRPEHIGPTSGPEAVAFVSDRQALAFDYWEQADTPE